MLKTADGPASAGPPETYKWGYVDHLDAALDGVQRLGWQAEVVGSAPIGLVGRIARAKGSLALTSLISSASRHRCATRISLGLVMSWLTMFPRLGTVMIHHAI